MIECAEFHLPPILIFLIFSVILKSNTSVILKSNISVILILVVIFL